jgi:hypothetical protein
MDSRSEVKGFESRALRERKMRQEDKEMNETNTSV